MGLESALVGLTALSSGLEVAGQVRSADAQRQALELRQKQEQLQANDQSIQELDKTRAVISQQRAQAAASGIDPSSASLFAIQRDTFNKFAQDQKIRDDNQMAINAQINQQRDQLNEQELFGVGSNFLGAVTSIEKQKRLNQLLGIT